MEEGDTKTETHRDSDGIDLLALATLKQKLSTVRLLLLYERQTVTHNRFQHFLVHASELAIPSCVQYDSLSPSHGFGCYLSSKSATAILLPFH